MLTNDKRVKGKKQLNKFNRQQINLYNYCMANQMLIVQKNQQILTYYTKVLMYETSHHLFVILIIQKTAQLQLTVHKVFYI